MKTIIIKTQFKIWVGSWWLCLWFSRFNRKGGKAGANYNKRAQQGAGDYFYNAQGLHSFRDKMRGGG